MSNQEETTGQVTSPADPETTSRSGWSARWPLVVWAVLVVGLAGWVALGSVSTTSYTYNQFLQMTFRNDRDVRINDIWTYQMEHLPDAGSQWLVEAAFVVSVGLILLSVAAGCWLLLVRSSDVPPRRRREGRHLQDAPSH